MELLNNPDQPESDMILVNYQEKQEFIEDCPFGNVVLAAFTTAHARLHLYGTLEPLGSRVLIQTVSFISTIRGNLTLLL